MSPRSGRRARIIVIVIVVGCLLFAAVLDRSSSDDAKASTDLVALGPRVPDTEAVETAWYCAEGTANPNGRADERVYIANVDQKAARARISVMQGPDTPPKVAEVNVAAGTVGSLRVGDILPIAEPGVLVEVTGARAVVTHSITGDGDSGVGPCARDAAPEWHFAGATTVKGAQVFLALFNPFSDDAIVDIDFITDAGPLAPEDLQGFVVPAHSKVTVPVHDQARRDNLVGTHVSARRGRVIAEQSQTLDGSDGRKGLSLSLGAPELSKHWEFANASILDGRSETMVIANPATVPTSATIRTRLDGGVLEPETVNIQAGTSVAVNLGARVPVGVGFSVAVDADVPVIAESFVAVQRPIPSGLRGLATEIGSSRAARRWIDVPARSTPSSQDFLAVLNPGRTAVTFRLRIVRNGTTVTPPKTERVRLGPGKRSVIDLGALKATADGFAIVDATAPVVVDRESSGMPGITIAATIPDYNR